MVRITGLFTSRGTKPDHVIKKEATSSSYELKARNTAFILICLWVDA